jgi:hypothetical protein
VSDPNDCVGGPNECAGWNCDHALFRSVAFEAGDHAGVNHGGAVAYDAMDHAGVDHGGTVAYHAAVAVVAVFHAGVDHAGTVAYDAVDHAGVDHAGTVAYDAGDHAGVDHGGTVAYDAADHAGVVPRIDRLGAVATGGENHLFRNLHSYFNGDDGEDQNCALSMMMGKMGMLLCDYGCFLCGCVVVKKVGTRVTT